MGASRRFCEGWPISTTSYPINVALNTLATVGWKSKAAQSPHRTGSSICKSSPQAAFSEWLKFFTTKLGGMWHFQLDDEALDDLKVELIEGQRLASDERGTVLVWTGDGGVAPMP